MTFYSHMIPVTTNIVLLCRHVNIGICISISVKLYDPPYKNITFNWKLDKNIVDKNLIYDFVFRYKYYFCFIISTLKETSESQAVSNMKYVFFIFLFREKAFNVMKCLTLMTHY